MAHPCIGWSARIFRIRRSRVPWTRSAGLLISVSEGNIGPFPSVIKGNGKMHAESLRRNKIDLRRSYEALVDGRSCHLCIARRVPRPRRGPSGHRGRRARGGPDDAGGRESTLRHERRTPAALQGGAPRTVEEPAPLRDG